MMMGRLWQKGKQMKKIKIGELTLNLEELRGCQELMDYFKENGATHTALMDFCEGYREKYNNELCWPYPISDGKHLGTFFVLVKEGVLSLPYDDADKENYELFCMDDAALFRDYADMEIFMDDWKLFHDDLMQAMTAMRNYLFGQEERINGKN